MLAQIVTDLEVVKSNGGSGSVSGSGTSRARSRFIRCGCGRVVVLLRPEVGAEVEGVD